MPAQSKHASTQAHTSHKGVDGAWPRVCSACVLYQDPKQEQRQITPQSLVPLASVGKGPNARADAGCGHGQAHQAEGHRPDYQVIRLVERVFNVIECSAKIAMLHKESDKSNKIQRNTQVSVTSPCGAVGGVALEVEGRNKASTLQEHRARIHKLVMVGQPEKKQTKQTHKRGSTDKAILQRTQKSEIQAPQASSDGCRSYGISGYRKPLSQLFGLKITVGPSRDLRRFQPTRNASKCSSSSCTPFPSRIIILTWYPITTQPRIHPTPPIIITESQACRQHRSHEGAPHHRRKRTAPSDIGPAPLQAASRSTAAWV
jgi:hypothetical protein